MRFDTSRPNGIHIDPNSRQAHVLRVLEQTKQHSVPLGAQFDAVASRERERLEANAPVMRPGMLAIAGVMAVVLSMMPLQPASVLAGPVFVLLAEWSLIFGIGTTSRRTWLLIALATAATLAGLAFVGEFGAGEIGVGVSGAFLIAVTCGGWWQGLLRQREIKEAQAREAFLRRN
jgi:hypothetical protein